MEDIFASFLGIPIDQVTITNVYEGSVIVEMVIVHFGNHYAIYQALHSIVSADGSAYNSFIAAAITELIQTNFMDNPRRIWIDPTESHLNGAGTIAPTPGTSSSSSSIIKANLFIVFSFFLSFFFL
jgi:hypothetical protein